MQVSRTTFAVNWQYDTGAATMLWYFVETTSAHAPSYVTCSSWDQIRLKERRKNEDRLSCVGFGLTHDFPVPVVSL
jgi:hypothetical protein